MVDSRLESPIEPDFPDPGESNPDAGVSDPGASVLVSDGVGTTEGPDLSLQTSSETPEPSIEPATPHLPELSADVQQDQPEVVSEAFSTNFEIDSVVSPELPDPPSATSDQSQSIGVDEAEPTQGASSEDDASIAAQPVSVEPDSSAEPISVAPELPTDPVVPEPIGVSPDLPPDLEPVATAPEPDLPPHLEPTAGTPDLPPDLDPIVGAPEPDLPSDLDPIAVAPEPDVPNEPIAPLAVAPDSPAEPMAPPAPIAPIQVAPDLPSEPAPPIASEPVAIEPPVIDDIAPEVAPPEVVPAPAASVVNAAERQAYYESKAEELGKLTAALARTRGVTSIFLVARDGSTIDSVVKDDVTEERVGELVKESFEFLLAYAKSPSYWVLECTGGIFVMQTLDAHHVLIAIGQAGANFGALRYTMDKTKAKFGSILDNVPL